MKTSFVISLLCILISTKAISSDVNTLLIGIENMNVIIYDFEKKSSHQLIEIQNMINPQLVINKVSKIKINILIYDQDMWIRERRRIDYEYLVDLEKMVATQKSVSTIYYRNGNYSSIDSSNVMKDMSEKEFLDRSIGKITSDYYTDRGNIINSKSGDSYIENKIKKKIKCGFLQVNESDDKTLLIGEYACWKYSQKNIICPIEIIIIDLFSKEQIKIGINGINPRLSVDNRYVLYQNELEYHVFDLTEQKNIPVRKTIKQMNWL